MSGCAGGKGVVCVRRRRGGGIPGWGSASSPGSTTVGCRAAIGVDGAAAVRVGIYGSRAIGAGVISRCATTTIGGHGVLAPHGGSGRGDVGGPSRCWGILVGERQCELNTYFELLSYLLPTRACDLLLPLVLECGRPATGALFLV